MGGTEFGFFRAIIESAKRNTVWHLTLNFSLAYGGPLLALFILYHRYWREKVTHTVSCLILGRNCDTQLYWRNKYIALLRLGFPGGPYVYRTLGAEVLVRAFFPAWTHSGKIYADSKRRVLRDNDSSFLGFL
jgi:hypothetical protein